MEEKSRIEDSTYSCSSKRNSKSQFPLVKHIIIKNIKHHPHKTTKQTLATYNLFPHQYTKSCRNYESIHNKSKKYTSPTHKEALLLSAKI